MDSSLPSKSNIEELYNSYYPIFSCILNNVQNMIAGDLDLNPRPVLKSRIKSFKSYYAKVVRQRADSIYHTDKLVCLTDMIGIRVVCAFLEDIPNVVKQISEKYSVREVERKGETMSFKEFGYESVHILINIPKECLDLSVLNPDLVKDLPIPEELCCEVQVRTILQDAWAEVEHELIYKTEFTPFDAPLRRKLACVNASLSLADTIFQEIRDYQKNFQRAVDERRETFYKKADVITDKENDLQVGKVQEEPKKEDIGRVSPYVRGTIDDMILRALQAHNGGNLDLAVTIYSDILNSKSQLNDNVLSVIHKHRGMAFFAQNKYKEALEDFEKSAGFGKDNFRSIYYMGIVYGVTGQNEKALEAFTKSLELNGFQSHAYYRRALTYFNLADYQKSLEDLNEAARLGLDNDECKALRAKLNKKFDMM
ncbi:MAG: (p)ppGpp synthetase [Treponema sp.]|nr:(p)ppGpp synthetase [Treponema sp.]